MTISYTRIFHVFGIMVLLCFAHVKQAQAVGLDSNEKNTQGYILSRALGELDAFSGETIGWDNIVEGMADILSSVLGDGDIPLAEGFAVNIPRYVGVEPNLEYHPLWRPLAEQVLLNGAERPTSFSLNKSDLSASIRANFDTLREQGIRDLFFLAVGTNETTITAIDELITAGSDETDGLKLIKDFLLKH